ncbi:MAG: hypothetical protein LC799_00355, partial [Actinobacteria bacterium]|nr:hypothetical protein [Actinomycetota bacterium]
GRAVSGIEPVERASLERLLQRTAAVLQQRAADPNRLAELLAANRESAPTMDTDPDTPDPGESSAP